MYAIPFAPPWILEEDIDAVVQVLRKGWITTGAECEALEAELREALGASEVLLFSSGTDAMELCLRLLGIGPGDEVITTPYTFTATGNVILHVGAQPVFADVSEGSYHVCPENLRQKITSRTKAIITVDFGGIPCDYRRIRDVVADAAHLYTPQTGTLQEGFLRVPILNDAAHALGARSQGQSLTDVADFVAYSLHAVKNLTTAEGGALSWGQALPIDGAQCKQRLQTMRLHGLSRTAKERLEGGAWRYDVLEPGYKANLTDIAAAMGRTQLRRYPEQLRLRAEHMAAYDAGLQPLGFKRATELEGDTSSKHLYALSHASWTEEKRNAVFQTLLSKGIQTNVHFMPLPMLSAYRNLGYRIEDTPQAYQMFSRELSIPLYPQLQDAQISQVQQALKECL